jgi:cold shock CspA family protein
MTYEFNRTDDYLNDFPNPYRLENRFLLIACLMLLTGGSFVLLAARTYLQARQDGLAAVTALVSFILFGGTVKYAVQALSQLRFYLGRRFPLGLAKELSSSGEGLGKGSLEVMKTMQEQALHFPEPKGPLNGVLYSLIKPLITSPPPIQDAAVRHFHAVVAMSAISVSMAVSWFLFKDSAHEGVVSWIYLPLTGLSLITPFVQGKLGFDTKKEPDSTLMLLQLMGLIVFAFAAPILIPRFVPAWAIPPMWVAPLLLLVGSISASTLFLASLLSQMDNVPESSVSCCQTTISMNCHPAQLWPKVSRDFQDTWVRNIPNRVYANVPPVATARDRGKFEGVILEETQPTTSQNMGFASLREALQVKYVRFLVGLCVWGVVLSVAAAGFAVYVAPGFAAMGKMEITRSILVVVSLLLSSVLAFRIGHLLWSRMYFRSRLTWIGLDGTYQTGEMRIGNQFTGNVQSRAAVTRVEDATLRVWMTDITSISFGKDGKRHIMAMLPVDGMARSTAERLKEFASEQSSIAAPTSTRDIGKAEAVLLLDQAMGSVHCNGASALPSHASAKVEQLGHEGQRTESALQKDRYGRVKFYDAEKKFGFVTGDDGIDRFFNSNQLLHGAALKAGDRVSFMPTQSDRGEVARKVRELAWNDSL